MQAPVALRGKYYNTHLAHRCPNHHSCVMCKKCTNFNQHNAMCKHCELGQNYGCNHTEKQKMSFIQIERFMKRPMFEQDAKINNTETTSQYVDEQELQKLESDLGNAGIVAE